MKLETQDLQISELRQRAAQAREEAQTCADTDLRLYLTARANQADCEAGARERYLRSTMKVSIHDQILCVERELRQRRRTYARWVAADEMSPVAAAREVEIMEAVLTTLQSIFPPVGGLVSANERT